MERVTEAWLLSWPIVAMHMYTPSFFSCTSLMVRILLCVFGNVTEYNESSDPAVLDIGSVCWEVLFVKVHRKLGISDDCISH